MTEGDKNVLLPIGNKKQYFGIPLATPSEGDKVALIPIGSKKQYAAVNISTPSEGDITPLLSIGNKRQYITVGGIRIPILASLDPATVWMRWPSFPLLCDGSYFTPSSVVKLNGDERITTFISSSELSAAILDTDILLPRSLPVTVLNSAGESNAINLIVDCIIDGGFDCGSISCPERGYWTAYHEDPPNEINTNIDGIATVDISYANNSPYGLQLANDNSGRSPTHYDTVGVWASRSDNFQGNLDLDFKVVAAPGTTTLSVEYWYGLWYQWSHLLASDVCDWTSVSLSVPFINGLYQFYIVLRSTGAGIAYIDNLYTYPAPP